jgi:hypothetical protein
MVFYCLLYSVNTEITDNNVNAAPFPIRHWLLKVRHRLHHCQPAALDRSTSTGRTAISQPGQPPAPQADGEHAACESGGSGGGEGHGRSHSVSHTFFELP